MEQVVSFKNLTIPHLKKHLQARELATTGLKRELLHRLYMYEEKKAEERRAEERARKEIEDASTIEGLLKLVLNMRERIDQLEEQGILWDHYLERTQNETECLEQKVEMLEYNLERMHDQYRKNEF